MKHISKSSLSFFSLHASVRKMKFCIKKKIRVFICGLKTFDIIALPPYKYWCQIMTCSQHTQSFTAFFIDTTWNANSSSILLIHHCIHLVNIFHQPLTSLRVPPCSLYIIRQFPYEIINWNSNISAVLLHISKYDIENSDFMSWMEHKTTHILVLSVLEYMGLY